MTQFYCFHLAQELLTTDLLSYSFPRLHVNMKCPKYICGENHWQVHCSPFNAFAVFNTMVTCPIWHMMFFGSPMLVWYTMYNPFMIYVKLYKFINRLPPWPHLMNLEPQICVHSLNCQTDTKVSEEFEQQIIFLKQRLRVLRCQNIHNEWTTSIFLIKFYFGKKNWKCGCSNFLFISYLFFSLSF
jgi:hypothetical protein